MKLGIVFGGKSWEHEISIVSAIAMKKVLNEELFYIFVDQNRDLYLIPTNTITSKLFSSGEYKKCDKLSLTQGGFLKSSLFGSKEIKFDCILNLIHGADGEDGTIASLFNFFNINFIGPRTDASVVSFDKNLTKAYASNVGVKSLPFTYFTQNDEITVEKFPVIIKPCKLGSSIGISIVKDQEELDYALDVAFEFDTSIIIEPFIDGVKEYNLAGTKIDGEFVFSIVEEPKKEEFLDFDKKYLDFNRTEKVFEANLDEIMQEKLKENFKKIYNTTFDGALIRCDFFIIENEVYINEINPIPGSMANYLFDNFNETIVNLSSSLPEKKNIKIDYTYVNKIQSAKGKA